MFLPSNITLKMGDSGDFVAELQRRLSVINYFNADAINGLFDGVTVQAVQKFQSVSGIHADGVAGPETLRRLNGALSGDNSSADNKAEEEAKKRAEEERLRLEQQAAYLLQQQQQAQIEEQALLAQQQLQAQIMAFMPSSQPAPAAPMVEAQQQPQAYAPPQPAAPVQPIAQQNYAPPAPMQPPQPTAPMQQPPAMTAGDMLAQMLLQAAQQPQAQQPQQRPTQQPSTQPQALAQIETQQVAVAAEPRGIVGRAVQYANEVIQKLANYFESKLPAPVLNEVKEIGHTMARAGMQESPIAGAEQQKERGIEQGKGQQQGRQVG